MDTRCVEIMISATEVKWTTVRIAVPATMTDEEIHQLDPTAVLDCLDDLPNWTYYGEDDNPQIETVESIDNDPDHMQGSLCVTDDEEEPQPA